MYKDSRDLALFLEQLRVSRGLSQEDFTEGIISNRQYQRYINGSSAMPFHLLDAFSERLNIKKEILLLEFDNYASKETQLILDYFNAVSNKDLINASKIKENINSKYIMDYTNLMLYNFSELTETYILNKIDKIKYVSELSKLIDYPKILKKATVNTHEVVILSTLLDNVSETEKTQIVSKLSSFLSNPNLVWTGSEIITYNVVLFRLAKYSGIIKDFERVINFCNLGIKLNFKAKYFLNLEYYYYFLALSYFELNQKELFEENLYRCFTVLEVKDNHEKTMIMADIIKRDFNVDLIEFVNEYHRKKYKLNGLNT
ncbi:helix-turn-helix domain-containing protein [Acholeplasma granularum]|uniref:helix-turn-helix domain-containing protein n=1 Tax=Acholeplasma granularum TaxID=264635 RepID=UPI00046ECAE3|nr:helix-turn-helix transcriptional regulator [Acholeplasma granularum]